MKIFLSAVNYVFTTLSVLCIVLFVVLFIRGFVADDYKPSYIGYTGEFINLEAISNARNAHRPNSKLNPGRRVAAPGRYINDSVFGASFNVGVHLGWYASKIWGADLTWNKAWYVYQNKFLEDMGIDPADATRQQRNIAWHATVYLAFKEMGAEFFEDILNPFGLNFGYEGVGSEFIKNAGKIDHETMEAVRESAKRHKDEYIKNLIKRKNIVWKRVYKYGIMW